MLTQQQLEQYHRDGFLKGDVVLSDEAVEQLRNELDLVLEGKTVKKPVLQRDLSNPEKNSDPYNSKQTNETDGMGMSMEKNDQVVQVVNIWMASDAFLQHAGTTKICEEIAQLTQSDTLRIWHDQVQYKPPITGGPTRWHQDHPAWPIIQPADLVSAWVALDDATIDNGCMWMVPGSHLWGDQQRFIGHGDDHLPFHRHPDLLPEGVDLTAVPFEIKKGQVGYHHCLTWHGAYPNRSERKRRAIAVHYMPGNVRYEPTGSHPMEPHITVQPGELLSGDAFPIIFQQARQ
ncbi:phytanoyl-CoA dioxygenase family protein [Paenibacillaceae bacterium]|nr:phytanoyl-CoA dioxygenase family protein [Paenibacillaceae bacterium]